MPAERRHSPVLEGTLTADGSRPAPLVVRVVMATLGLSRLPGYFFAYGVVRERPPAAARR